MFRGLAWTFCSQDVDRAECYANTVHSDAQAWREQFVTECLVLVLPRFPRMMSNCHHLTVSRNFRVTFIFLDHLCENHARSQGLQIYLANQSLKKTKSGIGMFL